MSDKKETRENDLRKRFDALSPASPEITGGQERGELRRTITSVRITKPEKLAGLISMINAPISPPVSSEDDDYCPDVDSVLKWFKESKEMFPLSNLFHEQLVQFVQSSDKFLKCWLQHCAIRYRKWILIKKKQPKLPLYLPEDIKLVHQLHLLKPVAYSRMCKKAFGKVLDLQKSAKKATLETSERIWTMEYGPAEPLRYLMRAVVATDYFVTNKENELRLRKGDTLFILETNADGWWAGVINGSLGFFPVENLNPNLEDAYSVKLEKPSVFSPKALQLKTPESTKRDALQL